MNNVVDQEMYFCISISVIEEFNYLRESLPTMNIDKGMIIDCILGDIFYDFKPAHNELIGVNAMLAKCGVDVSYFQNYFDLDRVVNTVTTMLIGTISSLCPELEPMVDKVLYCYFGGFKLNIYIKYDETKHPSIDTRYLLPSQAVGIVCRPASY